MPMGLNHGHHNPDAGKDIWDKLSSLSGLLASVLVPLSLGLVGHFYSNAIKEQEVTIKDREVQLKEQEFSREWIQIALGILSNEEVRSQNNMQDWAVRVINHYIDDEQIRMQEALRGDLVAGRARLPVSQSASPPFSDYPRPGMPPIQSELIRNILLRTAAELQNGDISKDEACRQFEEVLKTAERHTVTMALIFEEGQDEDIFSPDRVRALLGELVEGDPRLSALREQCAR